MARRSGVYGRQVTRDPVFADIVPVTVQHAASVVALREHLRQLAALKRFERVVAATEVLAADKDIGNGALASDAQQGILQVRAAIHQIKLNGCVLGVHRVKQSLRRNDTRRSAFGRGRAILILTASPPPRTLVLTQNGQYDFEYKTILFSEVVFLIDASSSAEATTGSERTGAAADRRDTEEAMWNAFTMQRSRDTKRSTRTMSLLSRLRNTRANRAPLVNESK